MPAQPTHTHACACTHRGSSNHTTCCMTAIKAGFEDHTSVCGTAGTGVEVVEESYMRLLNKIINLLFSKM